MMLTWSRLSEEASLYFTEGLAKGLGVLFIRGG